MKLKIIGILFSLLLTGCATKGDIYKAKLSEKDAKIQSAVAERNSAISLSREIQNEIERLKEENEKLRERNSILQRHNNEYSERIKSAEITNILECKAQIDSCEALRAQYKIKAEELRIETKEKAYALGMLRVWEALSIVATPEERGMLFKDHYLNIMVKVDNRVTYQFRVKTEEKENGFSKVLSTTADIASLIMLKKPI